MNETNKKTDWFRVILLAIAFCWLAIAVMAFSFAKDGYKEQRAAIMGSHEAEYQFDGSEASDDIKTDIVSKDFAECNKLLEYTLKLQNENTEFYKNSDKATDEGRTKLIENNVKLGRLFGSKNFANAWVYVPSDTDSVWTAQTALDYDSNIIPCIFTFKNENGILGVVFADYDKLNKTFVNARKRVTSKGINSVPYTLSDMPPQPTVDTYGFLDGVNSIVPDEPMDIFGGEIHTKTGAIK